MPVARLARSPWGGRAAILHADLDAFYASVEQLLDPSLRSQPIAVGGGVVLAASYEARQFGVSAGMSGWRARRLCPEAVFLAPDFPYYREVSAQVVGIVRSHVASVEVIGLDEAYLELTGLPDPVARMRAIVAEIAAATELNA